MGAYEKSTDVNQIAAVSRENPENAYRVCSMGIIYRDPEDSYYDDAEFAIVKGNTVFGNLMADVRLDQLPESKGSEEFQKYMEDLTDMQNHVLPYLQSFCNLEEKGVKERREQQIAERNEGRVDERGTSTEANAVVKDTGKADRKLVQQKQAVAGKDKKLSIHERLEINKKIIQEKQGKDKPERGADLGVRTV